MGIERFEDGGEDPTQQADAGPPKDTGRPGDAGRSGEVPRSGDVGRLGDPTPDNSHRESPEMADIAVKRAESRTRNEYADGVAPPGSPPIDEDSSKHDAEEPSRPETEHREAMPSGHGRTEGSRSGEEPDEQHAEEHWDSEQSHAPNDPAGSGEEQRSPDDPTIERDNPDRGSTAPSVGHDEQPDDVKTKLGLDKESDAEPRRASDDPSEPSIVGDLDSSVPEAASTQDPGRATGLEQEVTPSPEPNEKNPAEGPLAPEDSDQDTSQIDEPTSPLTDHEWAEHLTEVRNELEKAHAEGLATDHKYTIDPDRLRWNRERRQLHSQIVEAIYAHSEHVPCNRSAIMAGGLGGAGKTTILKEQANVDLTKYLMINPDDIKEEMARRGLVPEIEGLSPMESSDLVHEESSAIAKSLARRAYSEGRNLIWDITMSSLKSTHRRIRDMREAGYTSIDGIFVDIPINTSVRRTEARHRFGHEEFRAGSGLGGRFVPPEVVRAQTDSDWGSLNRRTFEGVKDGFDNWYRYDNSIDDQPATLAQSNARKQI